MSSCEELVNCSIAVEEYQRETLHKWFYLKVDQHGTPIYSRYTA